MDMLLEGFQKSFRENSERWIGRFDHQEAGAQLLLQAFPQRISTPVAELRENIVLIDRAPTFLWNGGTERTPPGT